MMNLGEEEGWVGVFTRDQATGAIPNGSTVEKDNSEPGDATPDGTKGLVLGSFRAPIEMGALLFYFVEWHHRPKLAVACVATKLKEST